MPLGTLEAILESLIRRVGEPLSYQPLCWEEN